jgi:hypothetical protein
MRDLPARVITQGLAGTRHVIRESLVCRAFASVEFSRNESVRAALPIISDTWRDASVLASRSGMTTGNMKDDPASVAGSSGKGLARRKRSVRSSGAMSSSTTAIKA